MTRALELNSAPDNIASLPASRRIGRTWRRLFLLRPETASFEARGFVAASAAAQARLEHIGQTFITGFNRALGELGPSELRDMFEAVDPEDRGFAIEGAAMGCAIADAVMFGGNRLRAWMACTAHDYDYLAHVGAGWALARVPWRRSAVLRQLDPIHGWLAYDGLGFHDGYFFSPRIAAGWRRLASGYAARCYDQGVGRAIWFSSGGSVARATATIARLHAARHIDLWAGLGLALAYAGGASENELQTVRHTAACARRSLAQGAAFAAEARARAGHVPHCTHDAVRILTGLDVERAVQIVRQVRQSLPSTVTAAIPSYELWRLGVQAALAATTDN